MTDRSQGAAGPTDQRTVSDAVIREVASTLDRPPERLDPPLFSVVDPDALNRLFHGRDGDGHVGRVEFTWLNCRIVVYCTGAVEVAFQGAQTGVRSPSSTAGIVNE